MTEHRDLIHEGAILAGEVLCQQCGAHCIQSLPMGADNWAPWVCEVESCRAIQTDKWVGE